MEKLKIKVGKDHTLSQLELKLVNFGYEKSPNLLASGEYYTLGGLVKIFPVNESAIFTVEYFGDEIERIFDSKHQMVDELMVLPNILTLSDGAKIHREDYIVHEDQGVGQFQRVGIREIGKEKIAYIHIQYLNNDVLYVPFSQIEKLSSYIGAGRRKPKLSRLGGVSWKKTYKKVYEDALKVARELLEIYARREIATRQGRTISPDWDNEIVKTFNFTETKDQAEAIKAVYADLSRNTPMDRLICGDVGFGKTEVAIRAAAQVIANGEQAVCLVPTTVLAEQHFETFKKRFASLPVRVERLSRFISKEKQQEIIEDLENGKVDLLISTHKIIRSDINYKNLGLLIIDEEQKFGVKDKEKIKKLREHLDVLVLTATPIPRTLFMALSGLRDMSEIHSVPTGRKSIESEIGLFDEKKIREYINREIDRSGQVYYLHNEVATIGAKTISLRRQFPRLRVEVAHGQMGESALSRAMSDFTSGKIQILVCSTIIENGLDLANANTLIVEESDRFGLSELYQIRGRIGRSKKQAYAFFTYRDKKLTENAVKRLRAIMENKELGSGYNIALSDLEIRGGGNILGKEQHGNMEAVGLVLYSKLLKLAVSKVNR